MAKIIESRRQFKSKLDAKQDVTRAIPALMGDGNGNIEVTGQPGFVYIRVGDGDLGQAFNNRCPLRDNLAIHVGYDPITDPDRRIFQVLSVRMADYAGAGSTPVADVAPHHDTHQYGGGDDVYVDWRRLMGLRVGRPSGFQVTVDEGVILRAGAWLEVAAQNLDLSAMQPAGALSCYVLIALDATGVATATAGADVAGPLDISDCPIPGAGEIALAAVRLYGTQASIGDTPTSPDIVDLRFPQANTAGEVFLADLADYARGSIIRGGAVDWEAYALGGISGSIVTRNATDVLWSTFAIAGTAAQIYTFPAVGGTVTTGSGVANQIAYWSGANALTGSANLIADGPNKRIGIGTVPSYAVHVVDSLNNPVIAPAVVNSNLGNAATSSGLWGEDIVSKYLQLMVFGTNYALPTLALSATFYAQSGLTNGLNFFTVANAPITFYTQNVSRLVINNTSVTASVQITGTILRAYTGGSVYADRELVQLTPAIVTTGTGARIVWKRESDGWIPAYITSYYNGLVSGGVIAFGLNDNSGVLVAPVEMMRLAQSGTVPRLGIGTIAPATVLHPSLNNATTNAVDEVIRIAHNTTNAGHTSNGFGAAFDWYLESSTTDDQQAYRESVKWTDATHASRTPLYIGETYPVGAAVGHHGFWSYSGVAAVAMTVIPNATGDVTEVLTAVYTVSAITGGDANGGTCTLEPGDSFNLYSDGTDILALAVAADGSVTVQRTAGADTFKVSLWMVWQ